MGEGANCTGLNRALSLFSLQGRTAIVSGVASEGIGFSVAQVLAEAGANVAVLYNRNKTALDAAEEIARTCGVKCTILSLVLFLSLSCCSCCSCCSC